MRVRSLPLLLALAGCSDAMVEELDQAVPQISAVAPDSAVMPGPNRARLAEAVNANDACVVCHAEQAAQWQGSFHQRAATESAYLAALAPEWQPFCRGCHAPEADPLERDGDAVALGVGCVTCHLTDGPEVLSTPSSMPSRAPHPVLRSEAFAGDGACVGCHQFRFPHRSGEDDADFMQTTVREHEASRGRIESCADCHMPLDGAARSHTFADVRDRSWLRRNLQVRASRRGDALVVTLEQPNPGHAFPTGDLFRRLEVGAEIRTVDGIVAARDVRHLARHFEVRVGERGRRLVSDDRVFDEPRVVRLELADSRAHGRLDAHWWVRYQRVATPGAGRDPETVVIESSIDLHEGTSSWRSGP